MREILFRGKRVDDSDWVFGSLIISTVCGKKHYHIQKENTAGHLYCYEVLPETVGQYTGINDKNGNKIFEGDICKYGRYANWEKHRDGEDSRLIGVVTYGLPNEFSNGGDHHRGAFYLKLLNDSEYVSSVFHPSDHIYLNQTNSTWGLEITGSIHETQKA